MITNGVRFENRQLFLSAASSTSTALQETVCGYLLGENNEWGIVTENNEEALYQGIKQLLDDPALLAHYKQKAAERGKMFSTENTVKAVEEMLLSL